MPDQSIVFQSIADFIDELKQLGVDGLAENLVRVQVEKEEVNAAVKKYSLRAAYISAQGDLHQLLMNCGVSPPKANSGIQDGEDAAKEMLADLTRQLLGMELKVRKGMYVS